MSEYKTYIDEKGLNYLKETKKINWSGLLNSPEQIEKFMKEEYELNKLAEEYVYVIAVNNSSKILGIFEISHGTSTQIQISNREIFVRLCLCGATAFFLVHNHPSGNVMPSESDIEATKNVKQASDLMGIELIDHIIIGKKYFSFRESSLLSKE